MHAPLATPWYRRPPPGWMPPWLAVAVVAAVTCGSCAVYLGGYPAGTVAVVSGVGFLAGLVISMAIAVRLGRARSPDSPRFMPPAWIAVPTIVAVLVFSAYCLIDETLRQGYFDGYRRRRGYNRIPGPLAVGLGCVALLVAGLISIGWMWGQRRTASPFVGGLLGLAVLFVGLCVILARVWSHFA